MRRQGRAGAIGREREPDGSVEPCGLGRLNRIRDDVGSDVLDLIDVNDVALGHTTKQKWNAPDKWVWFEQLTHEPNR